MFWQGSKPCLEHIALVFRSLRGTGPQVSKRKEFADVEVWLLFFQAMVISFPGYLLSEPYCSN